MTLVAYLSVHELADELLSDGCRVATVCCGRNGAGSEGMKTMPLASRRLRGLGRAAAALSAGLALLVSTLADTAVAEPDQPTAAILGIVTGQDGVAVADVTVSVHRWDEAAGEWDMNSVDARTTSADGTFSISGLAAGRYTIQYMSPYRSRYVTTWWGRRAPGEEPVGFDLSAGDPPADRTIEMILGGAITGRITTRSGTGLAGAQVNLHRNGSEFSVGAKTGAQGDYEVAGLIPGSYTVHVEGPWGSSWIDAWWPGADDRAGATSLAIDSGTVISDINAELATPSTIRGRLLSPDGKPLAGVSIDAWHRRTGTETWDPASSRTTDTNGEFTVYRLRAGEYRLSIAPPWSGDPEYVYQWWPGTIDAAAAQVFQVPVEGDVDLGDITALKLVRVRWAALLERESPLVGDTLHAIVLVDSGVAPERTYRWFRDGVLIDGAAEPSYIVSAADLGARLSSEVVLAGPHLVSRTVAVGITGIVRAGRFATVESLRLEGNLQGAGSVLSVAGGRWEPMPSEVRYQWRRDGEDLDEQTSPTYTTSNSDFGSRLSVAISVARPDFESVVEVLEAGTACYPETAAPLPTVQGVRAVGSTLSVSVPSVPHGVVVGYQWRADGVALPGETAPTFTLPRSLVGKRVAPVARTSVPGCPDITRSVVGSVAKTALAPTPIISGTATVGRTLTVKRGTWTANTTFSYRWYAEGKSIPGATRSYLKLGRSVRGKQLTVRVTGRRSGYATVSKTSQTTRKVR